MHRWFFADEELIYKKPPTPEPTPILLSPKASLISEVLESEWKFTVKYNGNLCSNETVALSGNIEILGKWQIQQCVLLTKIEDSSLPGLWTITLKIPRKNDIYYRYLVCTLNGNGQRILRFWETHKKGRLIHSEDIQELECISYDKFGEYNKEYKVARGWIGPTSSVVQFKFYRNPFCLISRNMDQLPLLYVKLKPIRMETRKDCLEDKEKELKNSQEFQENYVKSPSFAFCEIASLGNQECANLEPQPEYGLPCGPQDFLIFHLTLDDLSNTGFLFNLYSYPLKAAKDVPPYHLGYQYVFPNQLKGSEGLLRVNIMCATKHRPIGSMTLDYLLIKPLQGPEFLLKATHQYDWKRNQQPLDIGHRGCGKSFWLKENILRENTVKSFQTAFEHGADMIEFDVHLTEDKVPIVYHDFQISISRKRENFPREEYDIMQLHLDAHEISDLKQYCRVQTSGLVTIPVAKFSSLQLNHTKIYELPKEDYHHRSTPCPEDNSLNLPFVQLEYLLKNMPLMLPFNIEIKWPRRTINYGWEDNFSPVMDKNEYVDHILQMVLRYAGTRPIVFSSFDADICSMVRLKQNLYPVMFICDLNTDEMKYLDPRGDTFQLASNFVAAMELLGIEAYTEDILKFPEYLSKIQERNQTLFVWGSKTRDEKFRKSLKTAGVDGIIYDRINHVVKGDDLKQTIFLIE
ncbi:glycerophosphocholine phosphodiesterase GPCPD1-like [Haematobia irritans]|uniref:glycerophosphocholine phosphodiesterase GPCPD1-like n=1 Tax=Haematobia irritans TaxID=7368 RepID=UPI003F50122A